MHVLRVYLREETGRKSEIKRSERERESEQRERQKRVLVCLGVLTMIVTLAHTADHVTRTDFSPVLGPSIRFNKHRI